MSCVDEEKATTSARMPRVTSPALRPTIDIANNPPAMSSWLASIHPRRRPNRPAIGALTRSMIGAQRNFREYASPTQEMNPIAESAVPESRSQ